MNQIEKLLIAIAIGLFLFIASDNIGKIIYGPAYVVVKQGYDIHVDDTTRTIAQPSDSLPEKIDIVAIMAKANVIEGDKIFHQICTMCHTIDKGAPNKVGPNLWGIVGDHGAHKDDYNYSPAMAARKTIIWTEEELYRYLYAPKQYVKGTKMAYAGLKDDQQRADVVAYLNTMR